MSAVVFAAKRPSAPPDVEVWSSVLFDTEGKIADYRIVDEADLPAAFANEVMVRLQKARIEPRLIDGSAWRGTVTATCFVNTEGRCGATEVGAFPGVPE